MFLKEQQCHSTVKVQPYVNIIALAILVNLALQWLPQHVKLCSGLFEFLIGFTLRIPQKILGYDLTATGHVPVSEAVTGKEDMACDSSIPKLLLLKSLATMHSES